jgi:hypothetical protein
MTADYPSGVGAKFIQFGGLEYFTTATLTNIVPIILIKPIIVNTEGSSMHGAESTYDLRIVYVKKYAQNTDIVKLKAQEMGVIVEALWDDWRFDGIALNNGQVVSSFPDPVEYEPREDMLAYSLNQELAACAVNVMIDVAFNRNDQG